jgi:hypothetical protein
MIYGKTAHNRSVYASPPYGVIYSRNVMRNWVHDDIEYYILTFIKNEHKIKIHFYGVIMIIDIKRLKLENELKNGDANYCRKDSWNHGCINVLNSDGNVLRLQTRTASFRIINKFGQEGCLQKFRIIIGDDNKVLWIGNYTNKKYFISCGEKIIELGYRHKYLELYPNISTDDEYFVENDNEKNDNLVKKYRENIGHYRFTQIENAKKIFEEEKIGVNISLDEHFEKGFFYKGLKWNINWEEYYGYNYITVLIDIIVKNGLFCIDIENVTYPFYGYILFDINEIKILEAKKS